MKAKFNASTDEQQVLFYVSADKRPAIKNDETMLDILAELNTIDDQ